VHGLATVVTRMTDQGTPAGGWEPQQRLSIEAALRHYTKDAAFAEGAEQERGTLAKGKAADFVVLSQDLLTVAPDRIKDVKVMLTVLAGQNSYRAAGF
jgi:predicted amidohydrolase YtcJ